MEITYVNQKGFTYSPVTLSSVFVVRILEKPTSKATSLKGGV